MRTQLAALAALVFAQIALAQQTQSVGTTPAGSGGANNPALIGAVPDSPPPRLPDGTPDFSGVWVGSGPIGDISGGLAAGRGARAAAGSRGADEVAHGGR